MADLFDIVVARKLAGGSGGGGGSSDFSAANVTVVASSMYFYDNCPCAVDSEEINACFGMAQPTGPTTIYTVPLYKGKCVWAPSDGVENVTVSGDATLTETSILITGDCTITIS